MPSANSKRVALLATGLVLLASGCTSRPDSGPELANEPPYWCELVPKEALAEVQGFDGGVQSKLAARASGTVLEAQYFGCSVDEESDSPWGFHLEVLQGPEIDKRLEKISTRFEHDRVADLPPNLGGGGVSLTTGWVRWNCKDREILIYLVLSSVAGNPDEPESYVISVLKVVQERYAQLAKCAVEPPENP